jgi:hypothetical protein
VGDGKSDANGRGGVKPEPEVAQKTEFDTDLPQDDANTAEAPPAKSAGSLNGLHAYREASYVYVGPTATIAWLTCNRRAPGSPTGPCARFQASISVADEPASACEKSHDQQQ